MRKSFTRFLGLFTLFCVLGFQVSIAGVTKLTPSDGNGNVAKSTDLSITFDYPLSQGSAYDGAFIQLKKVSDGSIVDQINVPSSRFTFSADMKTITMDVQATLVEGTAYYVEFPANVVKETKPDGTFAPNPVYTGAAGWDFTIGDFSKPVLDASTPFTPAKGATNVGIAAAAVGGPQASTFTIKFNEVVKGNNGTYFIKIYNANGDIHEMIPVNSTTYPALSLTATFTTSNLRENTSYYILVDAGAFVDASVDNKNTFDGITSKTAWTFTTRDYTAPVFASGYSKAGTIGNTSLSVISKLDEKGTVYIIVKAFGAPAPTVLTDFTGAATFYTQAITAANTEFTTSVSAQDNGAALVNDTKYDVYYIAQNEAKYYNNVSDVLTSTVGKFTVQTIDQINPTMVTLSPVNNAVNVQATLDASNAAKTLSILFSEPVKAGAGNVIIYNAIDNTVFESIDITSSKISYSSDKKTVIIKPATKLASLKTYYIKIANGVITDNSGNKFAGYSTDTDWRFTAIDYEAAIPTWSAAPYANSLLASNSTVTIGFNENVFSDLGITSFTGGPAGTVSSTIVVEKNNVVLAGAGFTYGATANSISVTPVGTWDENSTYVVKVLTNKVYDSQGNLITKELVKSFKVDSWVNPSATFNPAPGTVPSTQAFKVVFSEPVDLNGGTVITDSNVGSLITFVEVGGPVISFTATWDASKNTALLTPVAPLTSGKSYTITVSAGYQDKNVTGGAKSATGITSGTFLASDSVVPTVAFDFTLTNVSPATNGDAIKIKFSEPVFAADGATAYSANAANLIPFITLREGSATGTIINLLNCTWNAGGGNYIINPATTLKEGTSYYLAFSNASVYDAAPSKNPNIGNSTTFVTSMAPVLVSTSPANKEVGVSKNITNVALTFGETVKPNPGAPAIVFTLEEENPANVWTAITTSGPAAISFVGSSATISFAGGLLVAQRNYRVTIPAGVVLDADNNPSKAISSADFKFTVADDVAPVVASVAVPGAVAFSADTELSKAITITFNEEVKKGSGTITITDGGLYNQIFDVNSGLVTISSNQKTVSISHDAFVGSTYPGSVKYYNVGFPAGTFKDLSNNNAVAFTLGGAKAVATSNTSDIDLGVGGAVAGNWWFATDDNNAPLFDLASSYPVNLSDKNALGTDLTIKFNESISIADGTKLVSVWKDVAGVWVLDQQYQLNLASAVTVAGNTMYVALVDLADNTKYEVRLDAGAVKDNLNATNVAITTGVWSFSTGDNNGPKATFTVNGTIVGGAMTKVDRTSNIVITFDEPARLVSDAAITSLNLVDNSAGIGVLATNVIKLATGGNGVAMEASIDATKKIITIPAATIAGYGSASGTVYTLYVDNIEDSGNNLPKPSAQQSYTFTIDDYTAPVTAVASVTENKLGSQIVLELKYDEKANAYYQLAANGTTTPTAATLKANGTMVAVNSTSNNTKVTIPTTAETQYELFVVAADQVRNTLQADGAVTAIHVRTADVTNPTVATYGGNGKLDVNPAAISNNFKLTFGTNISLGTGNVYIYNAANNALAASTADIASPLTLSVSGKDLQITIPANKLLANSSYYINIDKGVVTDVAAATVPIPDPNAKANNVYDGLFDATTYTFKTKDNIAPVIADITPFAAKTGGVAASPSVVEGGTNQDIVVTFDEPILANNIGAGDVIIREGVGGPVKEVVLLTNSSTSNINGKVLTINPVMTMIASKTYEVELKTGLLKDAAGNATVQANFSYVVQDIVAPTVNFYVGGTVTNLTAGLVNANITLDVVFNENALLLDKSIIQKADVDSLVTLTDATGKKLAFSSTVTATKWVITPAANFKSSSTYTLSFGEIVSDAAGNHVLAQSVTFKTKRTDNAVLVFDPIAKRTDLAKDYTLHVTSSQSMVQEETTIGGGVAIGFFSVLENSELKDYLKLGTAAGLNDVAFNATISTDKKVITIDPVIDFASGAKYFFEFHPKGNDDAPQGTYPDLVDSLNIAIVVPASITNGTANQSEFTVVDYVAPVLAAPQLAPNKNYLNAGAKLEMTFNEKVKAGTGNISIYREDGTLVETIAASAMTVKANTTPAETVLEINPSAAARENNMKYYVIVPKGVVTDKSPLANQFDGLLDNSKWIYYTAETQNPVVASFSPVNGATNVFVYQDVVVNFDKEVNLGTGNVSVYKMGGDAFDFIRVPNASFRMAVDPIDAKKLTINFDRTLDNNTQYYVTMEAGSVVNKLGGAAFAGFMDNSTWTFTTENTTGPQVIAKVPADDATGVAYLDALSLKMTFDMPVAKGTSDKTIRVVKTSTGSLVESISVANATIDATGTVVTVPMTVKLADDTDYHVFIDAGAITNNLPSKIGFAGISAYTAWNFKTAKDVTAPTAISFSPVTTGLILKPAFSMTFSEPMAVGTGIISIYKVSDNTLVESLTGTVSGVTATFPLPLLLKDATNYYVKIGADAFKDKATTPVYYAGIADATTWTFATGDNSAPVATYAPIGLNEKTAVTLAMTFDEEVVAGAGKLSLYSSSNVLVKEFTAAELKIEGKVVSAQVSGLVDNTTYYLKADAGLVKDKAVNGPFDFKGIDNATDWTFKVGDNTAPTVIATPDKGDTMAKTFDVVLTFSEKVTGVTATDLVITGATINSVTADVTGKIYTVNITGLSLAKVTLNVPTTVKDMNGNAFVAIPAFNYTIDDFSTPVLVSFTPADETALVSYNIKNDTALVMTFSKPVFAGTGQIYVYNSLNQLFKTYSVSAANIAGKVVTVPVKGLKDKDTYVVTFDSGIVVDKHGVQIAALVDPTVWNFTVGDYSAPILVSAAAPAAPIKTTFDVVLTFNEAVKGVVPAAITVTNGTLNSVSGSGAVYTLNITAAEEAVVGISLPSTITDASINLNKYAGKTLSYTVGDFTAPVVKAVSTVTKNDVSVVLTFSPDAIVTASDITVTGATSNTITNVGNVFTVAAKANDMATVLVTVAPTVVDEAGNKITGDLSVSNLVLDNTAPTVVSVTPETATAAKNSFDVTVVFSEDVVIGTDNITVSKGTVAVTGTGKTYVASIKAADGDVVVLTIGTGVKDASGRNNLAVAVAKTYTIGDNTAPALEVIAPVAPVTKTFTVGLKFKEAVTGVSATSITVVGGTLSSLTGTGANYTLTIAAEEKATVKINIPKTVADLAGNLFAGQDLEYTVGDFTAPIVTADPASGENLKKTFSVVLTFSADAIVTTSDITATGGTIVVNPIVGNVCKVDVTAADKATVVLSVASTVADAAGNKLLAPTSFTYKVGDNTAPTVTITGPSAPIETSFIVSFNFSEVVTGFSRTSLTVTNGTIKQFVGVGADYLVSIVADEKAVVKLSIPADAVVDASGNKLAAKDATFTVGDFSAPKVTVTPPASPVATVFNIGLKFDEPVSGLLLGGSAVTVTNGKIVDITGKNDSYTIVVSALEMTNVKVVITDAIADLAGNKFPGLTLNYTTGDFTAPQLVAMSPTIDDVLANNHPLFKMTFSENVKLGAGGNLSVYKVNTTTPVLTIPITEAMILGKIVTIDYTTKSGLDKDARYYVMVDATALTDMAGNAFVGVSDAAAWTLKTGKEFITKIDPNSSLEFKVYPNPFVDFVNVDNASQLSKVVVSNIAGQVVKEVVTPTDRIQLNELRSGIYFMSLYNTDNVIVKTAKIVKR